METLEKPLPCPCGEPARVIEAPTGTYVVCSRPACHQPGSGVQRTRALAVQAWNQQTTPEAGR